MNKQKLTTGEVAKLVGVHPNTVRNYVDRGLIECTRTPAGDRRFSRVEILRFMEQVANRMPEVRSQCRLPNITA